MLKASMLTLCVCVCVCVCRYVCLTLAKMSASKGGLNILITEVALYRVWMCLFVSAPLARVSVLVHSGCCALKLLGPKHVPLQRQYHIRKVSLWQSTLVQLCVSVLLYLQVFRALTELC